MLTFTPLLGARTPTSPSQSLLELDGGIKILVNVGWDSSFSTAHLEALTHHVSTLSLILLTHPTIAHLGAYAHACKHVPGFARIPTYATVPVVDLGRCVVTDLYATSTAAAGTVSAASISYGSSHAGASGDVGTDGPAFLLEAPTPDEIASYFSSIHALKYSQPHQPTASPTSPPVSGLTVTAYGAGHTLGGTIWHIQHGLESVVYATDWNQAKENLIPGATLLSGSGQEVLEPLQRPTALICDAKGADIERSVRRDARDSSLLGLIRETVAQGGKVLIPSDSSARILELAFLLNGAWREGTAGPHAETYRNARVYMGSTSAKTSVRYLQSMLEWVEEGVRGEAEAAMSTRMAGKAARGDGAHDPLEWGHVRMLERGRQVDRVLRRSRPCVLLASDASLEWGLSQKALQALSGDAKNLVILTEKSPVLEGAKRQSLAGQLWQAFSSRGGNTSAGSAAKIVSTDGLSLTYDETATAELSPEEAAIYETYTVRQRQLHSSLQGDNTSPDAASALAEPADEEESDDEDDEDEDTQYQGRALNLSKQVGEGAKRHGTGAGPRQLTDEELGVNILLRTGKDFKARGKPVPVVHDFDVRGKRGRDRIFPFIQKRTREDAAAITFGEAINPDDFLRAEEREDPDGPALAESNTARGKRKRGDVEKEGAAAAAVAAAQTAERGRAAKKAKTDRDGKGKGKGQPDDIDAAIARATGESTANGVAGEDYSDDLDESGESDYEPDDASSAAGPRQLVVTPREMRARLRVSYVDFSGLHDLRALLMIIPLMRPRKLILTSASATDTDALAEKCREVFRAQQQGGEDGRRETEIFTPGNGEQVDASVDTNAWTLKLSRGLVRRLVWQHVKGVDIVALTGRLGMESGSDVKAEGDGEKAEEGQQEEADEKDEGSAKQTKKARLAAAAAAPAAAAAADQKKEALPVLDLATAQNPAQAFKVTQPVHVGDMRLADLRHLLNATGHRTAFVGEGTLLVDEVVVVRKGAGGRVEIEGVTAPGGYGGAVLGEVRGAVYRGLAVVAGV